MWRDLLSYKTTSIDLMKVIFMQKNYIHPPPHTHTTKSMRITGSSVKNEKREKLNNYKITYLKSLH